MQLDPERANAGANPSLSIWEATAELVSAGQEVVLDRVELLRTEITHDVRHVVVGVSLVSAGLLVAALGWVIATAAVVVLLTRSMALDLALALVGAPHLAVGVVLAFLAIRQFQTVEITGGASGHD